LRDTGLAFDPALIRAFDTSLDHLQAQAAALEEWLSLPEPPTAIIAPDDFAAMEIIDLIEARGLRVPEDIRVTGFDNRSVARRFHPSFPTSRPDFERLGEIACDLLLDAIEATGDAAPRSYLLEAPLHIRRVETRRGAAVGTAAAKEGFRHRTSPVPALGGRK
jgi:DNA-binding LacI/PurR family transcriptional regulator